VAKWSDFATTSGPAVTLAKNNHATLTVMAVVEDVFAEWTSAAPSAQLRGPVWIIKSTQQPHFGRTLAAVLRWNPTLTLCCQ